MMFKRNKYGLSDWTDTVTEIFVIKEYKHNGMYTPIVMVKGTKHSYPITEIVLVEEFFCMMKLDNGIQCNNQCDQCK